MKLTAKTITNGILKHAARTYAGQAQSVEKGCPSPARIKSSGPKLPVTRISQTWHDKANFVQVAVNHGDMDGHVRMGAA
jgi:hypothetical protein